MVPIVAVLALMRLKSLFLRENPVRRALKMGSAGMHIQS
jgi:hypothetical protein